MLVTFKWYGLILFKKIAKHGNQSIIIVPKILEKELKPGTIVKLTVDVMEEDDG